MRKHSRNTIEERIQELTNKNANAELLNDCYHRCANKDYLEDLGSKCHEVIFGRRGTGKTTLLKAFTFKTCSLSKKPVYSVYIDMENTAPNRLELKEYTPSLAASETYRRIMISLVDSLIKHYDTIENVGQYHGITYNQRELRVLSQKLLEIGEDILLGTERNTDKTLEIVDEIKNTKNSSAGIDFSADIKRIGPNIISKIHSSWHRDKAKQTTTVIVSSYGYQLDVAVIRKKLDEIIDLFGFDSLYVCIDEFSLVDKYATETIQPTIAQLLKDTLFRNEKIVVKIASLWHKSKMQRRQLNGTREGLELGEDIFPGSDLDTMFYNKEDKAVEFFRTLIYNIYKLHEVGTLQEENSNDSQHEIEKKCLLLIVRKT